MKVHRGHFEIHNENGRQKPPAVCNELINGLLNDVISTVRSIRRSHLGFLPTNIRLRGIAKPIMGKGLNPSLKQIHSYVTGMISKERLIL